MFPGSVFEDEFISFTKVGMPWGAFGFQAFLDIDISGGIVLNDVNTWNMEIDSDGDGEIDYMVTDVDQDTDVPLFEQGLSAYPNPFNPVTQIQWAINDASAQAMVVFDVSGTVVRHYNLSGNAQSGSLQWDGRDFNGRTVPSGIYFAVLQGNNGHQLARTKLTLLK